ncbi:uncharacterized protein LOC110707467 [Chenopodium quinoa]|uniref:uncharacterized protein LOC110707467 n=1 Tax=Chenopodium quinoa TaxID=63459 RepID=UPI000B78620B|nr:uncharacterized protein LOC110707467 [Chenopodium quinoa]
MKNLHINLPFLEVVTQIPSYSKFLKDILTNKRNLNDELITLPHQVSALVQHKKPKKEKDPRCFTLLVKVGNMEARGTVVDLGASVSLIPLSIAQKLNIGMIPTRKTIKLADRSVKLPCGELEDVPIQVRYIYVPYDFVVMDMEEDVNTPLILGHEALKTLGAVIKCKNNIITCEVADEKIVFEFSKLLKTPMVEKCYRVDFVNKELDRLGKVVMRPQDPIIAALTCKEDFHSQEAKEFVMAIEESSKEEVEQQVEIELESKEEKLEESYSIDDIKGIRPSLCMHRIHLEDDHSTSIEPQRRLNPNPQKVVNNEILKLREAGIIYAISDRKWVSPVHVVRKKGGMTIFKDEKREEISTRTVDPAKGSVIEKLPPPTSITGVRAFLGHAGSYRRFIKDFSSIAKPLTELLKKEVVFSFNKACLEAFRKLKEALISSLVVQASDWSLPFELMCDDSDFAVGSVLGQKKEGKSCVIYYAIIVYTDHIAVRYLMTKKEAMPRLIRWFLSLQDFHMEMREKKGAENYVADHLSRIPFENKEDIPINDEIGFEALMAMVSTYTPWYADIANYHACGVVPPEFSSQ